MQPYPRDVPGDNNLEERVGKKVLGQRESDSDPYLSTTVKKVGNTQAVESSPATIVSSQSVNDLLIQPLLIVNLVLAMLV